VSWGNVVLIGPDGTERPLRPDAHVEAIEPGARVVVRLVPFSLPASGPAAAAYDQSRFEVVLPMFIRGAQRVYQFHFIARTIKL
jgi:hypothetical protein